MAPCSGWRSADTTTLRFLPQSPLLPNHSASQTSSLPQPLPLPCVHARRACVQVVRAHTQGVRACKSCVRACKHARCACVRACMQGVRARSANTHQQVLQTPKERTGSGSISSSVFEVSGSIRSFQTKKPTHFTPPRGPWVVLKPRAAATRLFWPPS